MRACGEGIIASPGTSLPCFLQPNLEHPVHHPYRCLARGSSLLPHVACLLAQAPRHPAPMLCPFHCIFSAAVELNLRLMRWRAAPSLEVRCWQQRAAHALRASTLCMLCELPLNLESSAWSFGK